MKKTSWNTKQWVMWIAPPSVALMLTIVVASVGNNWALDRAGYWGIQGGSFIALNAYLSLLPSSLWANLTMLGDGSILLPIFSLLIIWRRQYFIAVIASVPLAAIFSAVGKKVASIPRPAAVLDNGAFNIVGETLTSYNSMPSGHTITVFTALIAVSASAYSNPRHAKDAKYIWLLIFFAVLLGLSRVAVGAHWPLDVVAGAALGWISGLVGSAISRGSNAQWFYSLRGCQIMGLILIVLSYSLAQRALISNNMDFTVVWISVFCGLITAMYLFSQNKGELILSSIAPKKISLGNHLFNSKGLF